MTTLTKPQFEALQRYAKYHGRTWKSKLNDAWLVAGRDIDCELQQVRNNLGPSWLKKFQFRMYDGVKLP
jgi:hypothetical protein